MFISSAWGEIASVIVASVAIPAGAIVVVLVLVFELDHLERRRMNGHLDPAPLGVAAVDPTSSITLIGALSPSRGGSLMMRV